MKCLAVNTATTTLSIAIVDGDKTLFHYATPETRDQGNILLSHIKRGLAESGLTFKDLDLLAVVTGPGSFTGIRIGVAAMRGIALASEKPIVGVTSFEMFAEEEGAVVAVESLRDELYFSAGDADANVTPEIFAATLPKDKPLLICGDAREKLAAHLQNARVSTKTADAIRAAQIAVKKDTSEKPVPYYLREADVTKPKT